MKDKKGRVLKLGDKCFYSEMPSDNYADCIGEIKRINNELRFVGQVVRDLGGLHFTVLEDDNPVSFIHYSLDGDRIMDLLIIDNIEFTEEYMMKNANKINRQFLINNGL